MLAWSGTGKPGTDKAKGIQRKGPLYGGPFFIAWLFRRERFGR